MGNRKGGEVGVASFGHVAIGLAAGRLDQHLEPPPFLLWRAMFWFSLMSLLPDADVVAFSLGIPYEAPFGHRGASHSLLSAPVLAILPSLMLSQYLKISRLRTWLLGTAVVLTHGLLDTLTDGGLGVALLWPFSDERFFAPWQPIPVAPIGRRMLSSRGLFVVANELLMFLPFLVYAFWPRARGAVPTEIPPDPDSSAGPG